MGEKHSRKPWRWSANKPMVVGAEGLLLDADGRRVLVPRGEPTVFVSEDDARLIEAAPELLERLRHSANCSFGPAECFKCAHSAAFVDSFE